MQDENKHNGDLVQDEPPTRNGDAASSPPRSLSALLFWKLALMAVVGIVVSIFAVSTDTFDKSSPPVSTQSSSSASASEEDVSTTKNSPSASPTSTNTHQSDASTNAPTSPTKASTTQEANEPTETETSSQPLYTQRGSYRLLDQWPHDTKAYCQGLEVKNKTHLYESIGLYGESAMRIVETRTGMVTLQTNMADAYFGEGVTLVHPPNDDLDPYLLQLTWREKTAFTYHPETLEQLASFSYQTTNSQGWGGAFDLHQKDKHIVYVTDGTQFVHTWQMSQNNNNDNDQVVPGTWSYQEIAKVPVTFHFPEMQGPSNLRHVNELEYDPFTRTLLANVYFENVLIRIDIDTGFVTKVYDLSSLYTDRTPEADVLNGIAVIPNEPGRLYVTGKLWPFLYYIELVD